MQSASPHPQALTEEQLKDTDLLFRTQFVPRPIDEVFAFFADAGNLEALTPPWLYFRILTERPIEMKPGALIDYQIRLYGVPMRWRTLISVWDPPHRFVDEQLSGPYRIWWHEHTFEARPGGTQITDHVRFRSPLQFLSHPLFVRSQLQRIFDFRTGEISRRFGPGAPDPK